MKKYISTLLSAVMLLALTGCSELETKPVQKPSDSSPAATVESTAAEDASGKDTSSMTIAIAMQFDTLDPALQGEYDEMMKRIARISDPAEFADELHKAEDWLIQEHCLQFPLFQFASSALVQSNLHGQKLKIGTLDFSKCYKD